jgi:hypothetical protein
MKSNPSQFRFAAALLLTAAALPLTALAAQEAQAPNATPVEITPPPAPAVPAETPPPPIVNAPPVQNPATAAPVAEAAPPAAEESTPPRPRPAGRTAARARLPAAAAAGTPLRAEAPEPSAAMSAAPAPAPAAEAAPALAPAAEIPAGADPAPAADLAPADSASGTEDRQDGGRSSWLLGGALALALAAAASWFLRSRRRRVDDRAYDDYRTRDAPIGASGPAPLPSATSVAPASIGPAAAAATVASGDRPWIELLLRPIRAGVGEDDARVEFELCVDNQGSAPAEDVRISTFMLAAGEAERSEMERALIDPPAEAYLPAPIEAGDAKRIASAVALPRDELQDSILPVVVAHARYRLPDGSEGRTSTSFAVGVPWDGDLAHFDVGNPSGLHEGVEARLRGQPHKV